MPALRKSARRYYSSGIELLIKDTLRLHLSDIRQFRKIDFDWSPTAKQFNALRDIPEAVVKRALCDLLGEIEVSKDWGGEETDLFSGNLMIGRKRYAAAFLLKGPARFHEMKLPDCGKNGDQIYRLFNTPADVFVVQHCPPRAAETPGFRAQGRGRAVLQWRPSWLMRTRQRAKVRL